MATMEKLIKTLEQLKSYDFTSADAVSKKKDCRVQLFNVTELMCNPSLQTHKDFVNYIGPGIATLIKLCDVPDSDIRLASDEGLCRVIKALLQLHSNRVLVELCRQIKKNENSPRVLKLSMNRFGELCHYTRPQKRRAYLANLLNAISAIASRKEEILHESLALFIQKVFIVMGAFAYENETKTLLKLFISNLSSESSVIRRCASTSISVITYNNRKPDVMLALVLDYLLGQITLHEGNQLTKSPVVSGTLLTLKLLLGFFQVNNSQGKEIGDQWKAHCIRVISEDRIIQIFELCLRYSLSTDHNIVNAALETLQQVLKMNDRFKTAITTLQHRQRALRTSAFTSSSSSLAIGQLNFTPIPNVEESQLLETEVKLSEYDKHSPPSVNISEESNCDSREPCSAVCQDAKEIDVTTDVQLETQDRPESDSVTKVDMSSLQEGYSLLVYSACHLAHHFLLTELKGELRSDREVRVSVKNLALNGLFQLGSLEPEIWDTPITRLSAENNIYVVDVLEYSRHDDPQLRGQAALLACSILKSHAIGRRISKVSAEKLLSIIIKTLEDKEAAACRCAIQGIEFCMTYVLESRLCYLMADPLNALLSLASNSYWLVRVELLDALKTLSWISLQHGMQGIHFHVPVFQKAVVENVISLLIGDEDHRVRGAVANCLVGLVQNWANLVAKPHLERIRRLNRDRETIIGNNLNPPTVAALSVSVNGLTKYFEDIPRDDDIVPALSMFVDKLLLWLATSDSKFTKMGCIQSLATLVSVYPPYCYPEAYDCDPNGNCSLLKLSMSLMSSTTYMLDLPTHQSLLILATQALAGCVKYGLTLTAKNSNRDPNLEFKFLSAEARALVYNLLVHVMRISNAFCCVVEDLNPQASGLKNPLVTLPNPSSLSPIRRKSKVTYPGENATQDKEEKFEESRKWSKPMQLLNPSNLGYFQPVSLYVKLFDLLKSTYSTCKLNFDPSTTERLSSFLQSTLEALVVILEVSGFDEIGKYSEEILNYLRLTIVIEPACCLRGVQQLLKSLFGVNLSALWCDEASRVRQEDSSPKSTPPSEKSDLNHLFRNVCRLTDNNVSKNECDTAISNIFQPPTRNRTSPNSLSREKRHLHVATKFRTVSKMGPDKTALSSCIRLFEPMVVKALKLYTITSDVYVQKHVLDLLCELIHLCVNYCLLDADQVFLNFVIQQFEFLEEGFIPDVDVLLPSMFRFLSLLSYDRYHSKTIITVPRIMQLCGGLMATGKDVKIYVLPTLSPIVEDLFLSKERMNDNAKELETQKEVLLSMLLRLIHHHKVYPLLSVILNQTLTENVVKWKYLSKQICDVLVPQLQIRAIDLDSMNAFNQLQTLLSQLDPSAIHESLFGLLQVFALAVPEDLAVETHSFHRVLASRIAVVKALKSVFDEPFLLDCLNELNLSYLVNQGSDPLNVVTGENLPPESILANLLLGTLKASINQLIKEQLNFQIVSTPRWNPDESSFLASLVFEFILSMKKWNDPEYPRMNTAIQMQLNEEKNRIEMTKLVDHVVSYNPLVAIYLYDLAGVDAYLSSASQHQRYLNESSLGYSDGLNDDIGSMGRFFLACKLQAHDTGKLATLFSIHARSILLNWNENSLISIVMQNSNDWSLIDILIDFCLRQDQSEMLVQFSVYLIGMLELTCQSGNIFSSEILLRTVARFQTISQKTVHKKLDKLITSFLSLGNNIDAGEKRSILAQLYEMIDESTLKMHYDELCKIRRQQESVQLKSPTNFNASITKNYMMEMASKRDISSNCCYIIEQLNAEDVDQLSNNRQWLTVILSNYRICRPDLFVHAKNLLFQVAAEDFVDPLCSRNDKILWAADTIRNLLESVPRSKMENILNSSDMGILAKMALWFLTEMKDVTLSSMHLLRSAACIAKLGDQVSCEWSRIENLSVVKTAIDSLVKLITALSNGKALPYIVVTGLEEITVAPGYSDCASNIIRLMSYFENNLENIPKNVLQDLEVVVIGLCRTPLFYAYAVVPPSIWDKISWTPSLRLESSMVDLPVVPSDFLRDDLVLREFVFRIDKCGWINRLKFEEIWMSILGILNLNDESQFMPEEQACVIQASCAAVRALTMLLEKNLPFSSSSIVDSSVECDRISDFMHTRNGQKLGEIYSLIDINPGVTSGSCTATRPPVFASFRFIQRNLRDPVSSAISSMEEGIASTTDGAAVDIQSCVHFLIDLYTQWLQNLNTPYTLLVEVFRSLATISDFFTESQQFSWLLEQSLAIYKEGIAEDPPCLESSLILCILKSMSFLIDIDTDTWETVKKMIEVSMTSQHISTRSGVLLGLLYLLQKLDFTTESSRNVTIVNIIMDYVARYIGSEQVGPDWHHSLLWTMAFYTAERSPDLLFRSTSVVEYVVHSALNAILDGCKTPLEIQVQILQGMERLCIMGHLNPSLRRPVKKEIINIIRNIDRHSVFRFAVKSLLALVYTDIANQLHKPGADPETMLTALEWVGVLFQRMKRGADYEVDLLSRLLPIVTCDVFLPADILNRLLAEFMSASRPLVAISLTPTIFQVFSAARTQGQQSLVLEWILIILANFIRMPSDEALVATWNHLCFFTAASCNQWLRSVFSLVSRPINEEDPFEIEIFVAAAMDFHSQLDEKQRTNFASTIQSAQEKSRLFSAVCSILPKESS